MFHKKYMLNQIMGLSLLASLGFVMLLSLAQPDTTLAAATAPSIGNAGSFAVLGATAVTNTGPTVIIGDLGITPNGSSSVTGFPPGQVIGTTHFADGVAGSAKFDANAAFTFIDQPCDVSYSGGQDLGGLTLTPGVYCSASSLFLTGTLTLDAQGDPAAVWIFKMPASTLITASDSVVRVINGGQDCNVFWRVGSSATLGTRTTFIGTIIAAQSISMVGGANISGRALALNAAVTLNNNAVSVCSLIPSVGAGPVPPTVSKSFNPITINAGGTSTLTIILSNTSSDTPDTITTLTDNLPTGVVITGTPAASTTCVGGTVTATPGTGTIILSGGTIPVASGSVAGTCTVTVGVTAATAAGFVNTIAAGDLVTDNGNNAAPAIATLIVPPVLATTPVPTLNEWGVIVFMVLAGLGSVYYLRKHKRI